MLFYKTEFILFFAAVLLGVLALGSNRPRKRMLLVASYYFYAYWDWRFLGLIAFVTAVNYIAAAAISRATTASVRRSWLIGALVLSLSVLGVFKYLGFFVESLNVLLSGLGLQLGVLSIILPVGISFYTFQALSYTIDVYRGNLKPTRDPLDFALFVSFFPQLVAGPIVRASEFLPQLQSSRKPSFTRTYDGFRQFTFGLFKKVLIADRIAFFVDHVFDDVGAFDGGTVWLGVLAYTIQIYCDFSGYSDMAIGSARILGYDFSENFRFPYLAKSPSEFWRRWHISLSSWLRDYLYIPLGGSRKGSRRTYVNLMITMLLGGLWHGAAWTFVFWGAWHGAALAVQRRFLPRGGDRPTSLPAALAGWLATMAVVIVGWVFFRAPDFEAALLILRGMATLPNGIPWYQPCVITALALVLASHLLHLSRWRNLLLVPARAWYAPFVLWAMVWLVIVFFPRGFQPFIYFQF